jgi:hypothetical protein
MGMGANKLFGYQFWCLQRVTSLYSSAACYMLDFNKKVFALWAGSHKPRPASPPRTQASCWCAFDCCCRATTCKTGQPRFCIRETDTSCFDDDLHGGNLACATRVRYLHW